MGSWVQQGCSLSLIAIYLQSEYLTKEAVVGYEDFRIEQEIHPVKYSGNRGTA